MLTPIDLEKMEFEKAMLGAYKRDSVEENFTLLRNDYDTLYKENIYLKDKLAMMDGLVSKYKALEESMQNALIVAQTTADQMLKNAQEKADNIIKDAQVRIRQMESDCSQSLQSLKMKQENVKQDTAAFAARTIANLRAQIDILSSYNESEHEHVENTKPVVYEKSNKLMSVEYDGNYFDSGEL